MASDKEKETTTIAVRAFNMDKLVRLSSELFDITRSVSGIRSVHGIKLLYALAQSVQGKDLTSFPIVQFDISVVFQYLRLSSDNRRFEKLQNALNDIMSNPLKLVVSDKKGNIKYQGLTWITNYSFATDKKEVYISLNEHVAPFLLQLRQYTSIKPKHYIQLSTAYQCWFYPYLKNVSKIGRWVVPINDLKILLSADQANNYDPSKYKNANEKFLSNVLGITISEAAKAENRLAKAEKRPAKEIPWDFTKRNGAPNGTMFNLNSLTDLRVQALARKSGRSYSDVIFLFGNTPNVSESSTTIAQDLFDSQFDKEITIKSRPTQKQEITEAELLAEMKKLAFSGSIEQFLRAAHSKYLKEGGKYYEITY